VSFAKSARSKRIWEGLLGPHVSCQLVIVKCLWRHKTNLTPTHITFIRTDLKFFDVVSTKTINYNYIEGVIPGGYLNKMADL